MMILKVFPVVLIRYSHRIGTEHEISMDKIEVEEYNIDPTLNMLLVRAGIVSHVLDCSYIIDAGQNAK